MIEHDERSKAHPLMAAVDETEWHDRFIRIYDPRPNPNQDWGNCTECSECMVLNSEGNRVKGRILDMDDALDGYVWETHNDEFDGAWNRDGSGEDTGSSGLAAAKTSIHMGWADRYEWIFNGASGVVNAIMAGKAISVGTNWYRNMWEFDGYHTKLPIIKPPTGSLAGGHEWTCRGFALRPRLVLGRCWWGGWRDFWIHFDHLDELLLGQSGDAHHTFSVAA